jgi:hypothetical protein
MLSWMNTGDRGVVVLQAALRDLVVHDQSRPPEGWVLANDEPVKILLDLGEALWALLTAKPDDGACRH